MFRWLAGKLLGRFAAATVHSRSLRAGIDVAETTDDNSRHWSRADALSPQALYSPGVRATVRQRARYEFQNNSWCKGIVLTLANDVIGRGPNLQMRLADQHEINQRIEARFAQWADAVQLAEKLRTLKTAKTVDGEGFAHFTSDPGHGFPVTLGLAVSEADHFTSPLALLGRLNNLSDGIEYDSAGRPASYHRLKAHPGGDLALVQLAETERLPAAQVLHLFRTDRPGQLRGVSEIQPCLQQFAELRRYTNAVIAAAETAADLSAVMRTNANAGITPQSAEAMDAIPIEKRAMLTLPEGWDISQFKPEQPATTHEMFLRTKLTEIGRCLSMPYNVCAGDSSSYNYASGRLDHQTYFKSIRVEQDYFARAALDRILAAWLAEAALIPGFLPPEITALVRANLLPPHEWFWDGTEHVDPLKEANAQSIKLLSNTTTLAEEYARRGLDWEAQVRQRARELALCRELSLPLPGQPAAAPSDPALADLADQADQEVTRRA